MADRLNRTIRQANRAANRTHAAGVGGYSVGDFDMTVGPVIERITLVRIKTDILPEIFDACPDEYREEPNAVVQDYDDETATWGDMQDREIIVTCKDGVPLLENMLVQVVFNKFTRRWVPAFQDRRAHVRIPAGNRPDANGFYEAFVDEWDNENLVWVEKRSCYVRDANQ